MRGSNLRAVPGDTDRSYQTLLFGFDGRIDGAARAQRCVPLNGVNEVMQLPQVHIINAHALQGAVQFLFCLLCCTGTSFRCYKELRAVLGKPWGDAQFCISVACRAVYVIDPIALQYLQRAVRLLLCDSAESSGSKNSACAHVTGTAKWLCRDRHHFPPVFTRTLSLDKKVGLSSTLGSMLSRFKIRKGNESVYGYILPSHSNSGM